MKRRRFVAGSLAAGAIAVPKSGGQEPGVAGTGDGQGDSLMRTPLALLAPRADGVEAVWAVGALSLGAVEWEGDDGTSGVAATDEWGFVPQGDEVLRVRVRGLTAGAGFRVRAVTTDAASGKREVGPWKPFRTLDPGAATTKFVVWNDTHMHDDTIRKLHEVTPAADFLLWNGDTCNNWTSPDLLIPALLHPGGCDATSGRPMFVVWGNHDVRGPHAFRMPRVIATPGEKPYYAFRSGPVACICLNTGEDKPDDHPSFGGRVAFQALRREQARWLAETIRAPEIRDAPYRIVFCHIPLRWRDEGIQDYATGGFDRHSGRSREAWHDSLVAWKAQVVISGHTHEVWHTPADESFPYAQVTGGGPQMGSATWIECAAGPERLELKVHDLSGGLRHEAKFAPLA